MNITETEVNEIVKLVLCEINKPSKNEVIEQNEKDTLKKYEKMGYRVIKPFVKVLPIRSGKNKGKPKEYSGYVMAKETRVFAKVFTTEKRDKLENVWA